VVLHLPLHTLKLTRSFSHPKEVRHRQSRHYPQSRLPCHSDHDDLPLPG